MPMQRHITLHHATTKEREALDFTHNIVSSLILTSIAAEILLCAACGKEEGEDNKLKFCTACSNMVKYCNRECQIAHRPRHKKECRKRAAELRDEALFAQPPPNEDCPICFIPLPPVGQQTYQSCCGKMICDGCIDAHNDTYRKHFLALASRFDCTEEEEYPWCPFCRTRASQSVEEEIERLQKRSDMKDANAMYNLGNCYESGDGVSRDVSKAVELWTQATELGRKIEGVPKDVKKVFHYYEIAAKGGNCMARSNLGVLEACAGNMEASRKHFMISAAQGNDKALMKIKQRYEDGQMTKDDFATALRAHKHAQDEIKSEHRTKSANKNKDGDKEKCRCLKCRSKCSES